MGVRQQVFAMVKGKVCRVCRAILTPTDEERSPGECPYCGAEQGAIVQPPNRPDAPHHADYDQFHSGPPTATSVIPPTFFGKIGFALKLYFSNLLLISALVLTVWIPGHLLLDLINDVQPAPPNNALQVAGLLTNLIELVFGTISAGGVMYVLANRMTAQPAGYFEAIQVGFHNWWRLFAARAVAGAIIAAGALAFVVPGIYFAIRYSLLDPVVVLEGAGVAESRRRSAALVRGKEIEIFNGGALYLLVFLGIGLELHAASALYPILDARWARLILSCLMNVLSAYISCFLFTYFWEAHVRDRGRPNSAPDHGEAAEHWEEG